MTRDRQFWKDGKPGYRAEIVADSVTRLGARLTTMVWTFPRFILAEVNTHRDKERNSNSSRARPVIDVIKVHEGHWFAPEEFLENRAGMAGGAALADMHDSAAMSLWLSATKEMVHIAKMLAGISEVILDDGTYARLNIHKQYANRLIETFMWHDCVISGTHWANMFALRCHPAAQPEFQVVATLAREAMAVSIPRLAEIGDLHIPFVDDNERLEWPLEKTQKRLSTARCALISYRDPSFRHEPEKDLARYNKLAEAWPPHASAFGHVATATATMERDGPFWGWRQHRRDLPGETTPEIPYRGPAINNDGDTVEVTGEL